MSKAAFIAGDWGTSNLRLTLCDADGAVMDSRDGPGAAGSRGKFAEVFDGLIAAWRNDHGDLPALLCGMAGSTFGWKEAPYLLCPEELDDVASELTVVRDGVSIVPGMRCANPLGAPDVMRGEETQLLGAVSTTPALARGRHLVCMPGTHTKWVSLHDGVVLEFLTVPTGEVFRMLCDHSVLVRDRDTPIEHHAQDFERGLAESMRHGATSVMHRLFQSRSLRLDQQLTAAGAPSWTSGLLIGTDVGGALPLFTAHTADTPVYVVATSQLGALYTAALMRHGRPAEFIAGDNASLAGLTRIHRSLDI
jgi:2-dehydro-3-deoxygalactonokinase